MASPSPSPPSAQSPLTIHNNPYKAKRPWPPDFSKMDPKHQFRLERRWRRRLKTAYTRPGWTRRVKLVQYTSILGVLGYSFLYMDWGAMGKPLEDARKRVRGNGVPLGRVREEETKASSRLGRISEQGAEGR